LLLVQERSDDSQGVGSGVAHRAGRVGPGPRDPQPTASSAAVTKSVGNGFVVTMVHPCKADNAFG
jgi:hypothetical protein